MDGIDYQTAEIERLTKEVSTTELRLEINLHLNCNIDLILYSISQSDMFKAVASLF